MSVSLSMWSGSWQNCINNPFMYIRRAVLEDLPSLMTLFEHAKEIMRASGNLHQWNNGYPSEDIIKKDIDAGVCYVMCDRVGTVVATMAFIPGPDSTYSVIEEGKWPNDEPYYVIHRIAAGMSGRGYARKMLDWAFEHTSTVRIDTHRDNVIMRHILCSYGFEYCGVIYLFNGDPRDAYMLDKRK